MAEVHDTQNIEIDGREATASSDGITPETNGAQVNGVTVIPKAGPNGPTVTPRVGHAVGKQTMAEPSQQPKRVAEPVDPASPQAKAAVAYADYIEKAYLSNLRLAALNLPIDQIDEDMPTLTKADAPAPSQRREPEKSHLSFSRLIPEEKWNQIHLGNDGMYRKTRYDLREPDPQVIKKRRNEDESEAQSGSTRIKGPEQERLEALEKAFEAIRKEKLGDKPEQTQGIDILSREVIEALPTDGIQFQQYIYYIGNTCAYEWMSVFQSRCMLATRNEAAWCVAFIGSMQDKAAAWLRSLPKKSIKSWSDLKEKFLEEFEMAERPKKTIDDLYEVRQEERESNKGYYERFMKVYEQTKNLPEEEVKRGFLSGIAKGTMKMHFGLHQPKKLRDMFEQARIIGSTEANPYQAEIINTQNGTHPPNNKQINIIHNKQCDFQRNTRAGNRKIRKASKLEEFKYIPMTVPLAEIFYEIRDQLEAPPRIKSHTETRDKSKFCDFHKDHGHTIEECITLRRSIDKLMRNGELCKFKA